MNMRFIDTKMNFVDYKAEAKAENKTLRQAFIEREALKESQFTGKTNLIKDHAKNTQFFKDGGEGFFPVDAFQILDLTSQYLILFYHLLLQTHQIIMGQT